MNPSAWIGAAISHGGWPGLAAVVLLLGLCWMTSIFKQRNHRLAMKNDTLARRHLAITTKTPSLLQAADAEAMPDPAAAAPAPWWRRRWPRGRRRPREDP